MANVMRRLVRLLCEKAIAWCDRTEPVQCTGVAASWCPRCGDCTCADREVATNDWDCPLHGINSKHAERR